MRRGKKLLRSWLGHRRLALHLALLAVLLTLPALWIGWQLDDHYLRMIMLGRAENLPGPLEAFVFLDGDPEVNRLYTEFGVLPWWTVEDFRISFLRYVSLLSSWLDYSLWPGSAVLMHLHSLLWLGSVIALATHLYRRLIGPEGLAAGLAALLYAVDEAHSAPAAWLANRNALVATCFGLLCLIAHDRWRRGRDPRWALLSVLFLALGLASGELALATAGYLAAYALFLDPAPPGRRFASLLPAGIVLGAWAGIYRLLGFGVHGSGLYLDPLGDPAAFLRACVDRAPLLLMGQWTPLPADLGSLLDGGPARALWWVAVLVTVLIGCVLVPILRTDAVARFWTAGMLLALVPACATAASNRLLLFAGLGAMGLLGQLLAREWSARPERPERRRRLAATLAVIAVIVHLGIAPLLKPGGAYSVKLLGDSQTAAVASLPDGETIEGKDLIVVNAPDYLVYVSHIPTLLLLEDRSLPRRGFGLATAPLAAELTRSDESTLRVSLAGSLFTGPLSGLYWSPENPFRPGDAVTLETLTVTVLATTPGGEPTDLAFEFAVPLEHPSLCWVRWEDGAFVPFTPPGVGETVRLDAPLGPLDVAGRMRRAGS